MIPTPAPIPAFSLGHPSTTAALRFGPPVATVALTERHRPATLADMVGQGAAVYQLGLFVEAPASKAFLFEGPTGVGKTTAARALANDLGIDADWGLEVIKSAEADGEAIERALRMLRLACPFGSGWRMILVDEADLMTPKAAHLWLSALEDLPPRCVVVFTTNHADKFPDRFLDRCERIAFESDGATLAQDGQALVNRVWKDETGRDDAPRLASLANAVDTNGRISFRRVVSALDPLIRDAKRTAIAVETPAPVPAQKHVPVPSPAVIAFEPRSKRDALPPVADARRELLALDAETVAMGERYAEIEARIEALQAYLKAESKRRKRTRTTA